MQDPFPVQSEMQGGQNGKQVEAEIVKSGYVWRINQGNDDAAAHEQQENYQQRQVEDHFKPDLMPHLFHEPSTHTHEPAPVQYQVNRHRGCHAKAKPCVQARIGKSGQDSGEQQEKGQ